MSWVSSSLVTFGRLASLLQVIFYLPLALDLAGKEAFLALSASLASYYFILSTIRLVTKRTRLAWFGNFVAIFQFIVIPACLLICFNVYSPPSESYFAHVAKRPSATAEAALDPSSSDGGSFFGMRRGKAAKEAAATLAASSPLNVEPPVAVISAEIDMILQAVLRWGMSAFFFLVRKVPGWWSTFLRFSSPLFSLLEGVASVLVIQALGSMSRWV